MSRDTRSNLDELHAAADAMYRMLEEQRTPSPDPPHAARPASRQSTQDSQVLSGFAAEEADQFHRDEVLARQMNGLYLSRFVEAPDQRQERASMSDRSHRRRRVQEDGDEAVARKIQERYNNSLFVEPSDLHPWISREEGRPPRYSQVVDERPRGSGAAREDERYGSPLIFEPADSNARPPRYSQVVEDPVEQRGPVRNRRDALFHEMQARQLRDQNRSSLAVEHPSADGRFPRVGRVQDLPSGRIVFEAERRPDARYDEVLDRQMREQYNSSLAVEPTDANPIPPRWPQGLGHPRRHQHDRHGDGGPDRHGYIQFIPRLNVDEEPRLPRYSSHLIDEIRRGPSIPDNTNTNHFDSRFEEPRFLNTTEGHEVGRRFDPSRFSTLEGVKWPEDISKGDGLPGTPEPQPKKDKKKPQIRAKDYEQQLKWLAGQRLLGRKK